MPTSTMSTQTTNQLKNGEQIRITAETFPADARDAAAIRLAEGDSLDGARATSYEVFAEGWLQGGDKDGNSSGSADAWGRPVDVLVMPDGALLVSDDAAGKLYRIAYAR